MTFRVLILGDDPSMLEYAKRYLENDNGFTLELVRTKQEAKRLALEEFDIIISGPELQDGSVFEFIKDLRKAGINVPFMIFTDKLPDDFLRDVASTGVCAYIRKDDCRGAELAILSSMAKNLAHEHRGQARQTPAVLKYLIDSMPAYVTLKDVELKYISVNRMLCDFLGKAEDEILGKRMKDIFPEEFAEETERRDEEVLRTGKVLIYYERRDIKGKLNSVIVSKFPIRDHHGAIAGVASIGFDAGLLAPIEQNLSMQVRLFSNVFESFQDGIIILDKNLTVLYSNSAMNRIYPPMNPPVIGKKCYYAYDNKTSRCPDCNAWRAIEKKEIVRERIYRRDPDDKERWIEVYHFPLVNAETNQSEGVILYLRDITEKCLAERALSDENKFVSEILSSIQDGISILDKDLNIIRVNSAMERWYAHALPLCGKKCYEAYHGRTEPCTVCPTQRALKSGKPEYNIVPKTGPDGEIVGWLDLFCFPIRNPNTVEIEGVIEYVRDVTDREKMRMAAEASHQQLQSLFNSIEDPIYVFDPNTYELLFINSATRELFGDVVGQKCYKALQGLDAPCPFCTNDKIFGENLGLSYISVVQNLLTKRWYKCVDRAIMWPDNRIVGFTMAIDITDLKVAEERLRQANQKLSILGDVTRHDAYNQLATIKGYVDFIRAICQDKSILQYLERISDAAYSIQRQFEFVKDYQEIGVKGPEWVNVQAVFECASRDFKPENISIRNEISNVEVFADPMIEKVFHNLIENSIRHGKTVTEIRLRGEETDEGYVITLEDNGVGFPPELKSLLFKTRLRGRSGFGLYLASQILAITGLSIRIPEGTYHGARVEIVAPPGKYRIRVKK